MRMIFIVLVASLLISVSALAQDVAFKGGFPSGSQAQTARDEADFQRAVAAYRFWYPTVSCEGIFNGGREIIVTSPAMFRRDAGAGSLYWLGLRDATGTYVDGGKTYKLNVLLPVPGKLFWSVTIYDPETRSEIKTDQNKAALRSLFELKNLGGAKSIDLYFGPTAPAGMEDRWVKTIPGKGWFAYFRIYGPEKPAFDETWKPGDFEVVK